MERSRNWQGWAALILAGLALVVALSGRDGLFSHGHGDRFRFVERPNIEAVPMEPEMRAEILEELHSEQFAWRDQEWFREGDPRSIITIEQRRFGPHFLFGPLMFLFGLAQLIGLGLLIWLLFRLFTQKRNQPSGSAGAPPANFTPHDPRVE